MKFLWLGLLALAMSQMCSAGDEYCDSVTVTSIWTYYVTLPPTTITIFPPCPTYNCNPNTTITSTVTVNSAGPPATSTTTLYSGGSTIFETNIIISGGSVATTYTTTISGSQQVVSTFVSILHDFNGSVVTIESTTTAPGNHVSTGGIVGIAIGVFALGALLAACLLPFCIRRRPKKPEGYAAPPAQGYGTGYGT